jgi:hypothetical protein
MLRASTCQTNPWRHLMWSYFAHEAPSRTVAVLIAWDLVA